MTAPLTMAETAEAVGLTYDGFRKAWPSWVRDLAFPAPFNRRPDGRRVTLKWSAAEVQAWIARRSHMGLGPAPEPPPREARLPDLDLDYSALAASRREISLLMKGA